MRGRPARRFMGEMTPPRRPGESLLQFLGGISPSKFYFTGQHSPTIKKRAPPHPVSTGNNEIFNVRILLTQNIFNGRGSAPFAHQNFNYYQPLMGLLVLVF
jgi:hypothetical protein